MEEKGNVLSKTKVAQRVDTTAIEFLITPHSICLSHITLQVPIGGKKPTKNLEENVHLNSEVTRGWSTGWSYSHSKGQLQRVFGLLPKRFSGHQTPQTTFIRRPGYHNSHPHASLHPTLGVCVERESCAVRPTSVPQTHKQEGFIPRGHQCGLHPSFSFRNRDIF